VIEPGKREHQGETGHGNRQHDEPGTAHDPGMNVKGHGAGQGGQGAAEIDGIDEKEIDQGHDDGKKNRNEGDTVDYAMPGIETPVIPDDGQIDWKQSHRVNNPGNDVARTRQ